MFVNNLKTVGATVLLLTFGGTHPCSLAVCPQGAKESERPASIDDKPLSAAKRIDLYGDPLPEGVVLRLGTLQRRAVGAKLSVTTDGKSIVGLRGERIVYIWDIDTGKLRQKYELPSTVSWIAALSPDGRWLASHGRWLTSPRRNDTLTIWNVQSGKALRNLGVANAESIHPAVFSPDGERLAAMAWDGEREHTNTMHVWQLADGKEIFAVDLKHRWRGCSFLSFSADGKLLIAYFGAEGTSCWDIASGRRQWHIKDLGDSAMRLTPDGLLFCWQSPNFSARSLATGKPVKSERKHPLDDPLAYAATISPDGRMFVTTNGPRMIVRDMMRGKQAWMRSGTWGDIVFLPDSKSFITNNGSLQRWDTATGKPFWPDTFEQGHIGAVLSLAFSADGRRLVSGSADGSVRLWDATTGQPLRVWRGRDPGRSLSGAHAVDVTADGQEILSVESDGRIHLWHDSKDTPVHTFTCPQARSVCNIAARIDPDGNRIFAVIGDRARGTGEPAFGGGPQERSRSKLAAAWDAKTGELLALHRFDASESHNSALSRCGKMALVLDQIVDVETGKPLARLQGLDPRGVVFSPDGALVIGIRKDDQINYRNLCLWESATGQMVGEPRTETWMTHTLLHPNQRFFASNDENGVQLRLLQTGKTVMRLRMPERVQASQHDGFASGFPECLAFTPDGRRLAAGMPDGTILFWDVSLPPSKPQHLATKELHALWTDLADADAAKAWHAVWRLADAPQDAWIFLRGRVKPFPIAAADVMRKLLAELDSDSFEVREAAAKRLKELGLQAEPALLAALKAKPSLEQRRRIEPILAALSESPEKPSPEQLRQLRALIVLERIGTPEARRLLEETANGPPSARLTRQARGCLACMR